MDDSVLDKEAFLYASASGNEHHVDIIQDAYQECTLYLLNRITFDESLKTKQDVMNKLFNLLGRE